MTDKLTLVNLRVAVGLNLVPVRFATLSDLVEVIESLGGEVVLVSNPANHSIAVSGPGRYVIFKLEEE